MSRRNSRADLILRGARERVQKARERAVSAETEARIANAMLAAYESTLEYLEKDLAPTQRKVKEGKSTASPAKPRSSRKPYSEYPTSKDGVGGVVLPDNPDGFLKDTTVCAVPGCGLLRSAGVHFSGNPDHHVFHAEIKKKAAAG